MVSPGSGDPDALILSTLVGGDRASLARTICRVRVKNGIILLLSWQCNPVATLSAEKQNKMSCPVFINFLKTGITAFSL